MKLTYTQTEVVVLLHQASKLGIVLYRENTLGEVEALVKQELLKVYGQRA